MQNPRETTLAIASQTPQRVAESLPPMNKRRKGISPGWWFISPWLFGFVFLTALPFLASLYLSFCQYDVISPPRWIGLSNYENLFLHDPLFWKSIWNTFVYAVFALPLGTVAGIALALLLSLDLRGMSIYRTIFFLPSIVPLVATSLLWVWILNPQIGLINNLLEMVGISGPPWLVSPVWSKPALILMSIWGVGGSMIIYLAGIKDIPTFLHEAALVDGANTWQRTWHITLPMLTPVIFFNLVMGMIGAFQYFTQAFIMTSGGPQESTNFYCLYLFQRAFLYLNVGYSSAMAWILFVIVLVVTTALMKTHTKWVHYEGN